MSVKRENIFNSFEGLGLWTHETGANILFDEKENIEKIDELSGSKIESPSKILEKEIKHAEEILDEVSGMPKAESALGGSVEPEQSITEVSEISKNDNGIVSSVDKEERLNQAEVVAEEINIIEKMADETIKKKELLPLNTNLMRLLLSQKTKEIIRETSPELISLLNEKDADTIAYFEEVLKDVPGKRKQSDKIKWLLGKGLVRKNDVDDYNTALNNRKSFISKAKEYNVPEDVAKIMYKADLTHIAEIRGIDGSISKLIEEKNSTKEDKEIVSEESNIPLGEVLKEEPLVHEEESEEKTENLNHKEEYKRKSEFYKNLIENIKDDSEKERLLAAVKYYNELVDEIGDINSHENDDKIIKASEYGLELEDHIRDILRGKTKTVHNGVSDKKFKTLNDLYTRNTPTIHELLKKEIKEREIDSSLIDKSKEEIIENNIKNEILERNESLIKDKIENLQDAAIKCREYARNIEGVKGEKVLNIIKTLEDNSRFIANNDKLSPEEKLNKVDEIIDRLMVEVEKVINPNKINAGEKVVIQEKYRTSPLVLEKYAKYNIGPDLLKEIKGFDELTDGQKLLMLKNYESAVLSKIKTESKEQSDKEWKEGGVVNKLGKIGLSIISLGTARTYREKTRQKELSDKILRGDYLGFENRQAILKSLVEVAKESPNVHFNEKGGMYMDYVDVEKFRHNPYAKIIIERFNKAASEYSNIPFSWFDNSNTFLGENEKSTSWSSKLLGMKHGTLSGKERATLSDYREEYVNAKQEYLKLVLNEIGDSDENRRHILKELNSLDERVKMSQLFTSDPNAEEMLQDISDTNAFNQTVSEFYSKKGKYMLYGGLLRMSAVAAVTSIAAPAAMVVVGGMSYLRGKREARDILKLKRVSGVLSSEDLKEDVVYTVDLEKSLADLKTLLARATESKDTKAVYHTEARIKEVQDKLKSGYKIERKTRKLGEFRDAKFFSERVEHLVSRYELLKNTKGQEEEAKLLEIKIAQTATLMRELMANNMLSFGRGESVKDNSGEISKNDSRSIINRLEFLQALSLADTTVSFDDEAIKRKVSNIVSSRREKIDEISKKKTLNHIAKAVTTSASFAGVGYALAHIGAEFFSDSHTQSVVNHEDAVENIKSQGPVSKFVKEFVDDVKESINGPEKVDAVSYDSDSVIQSEVEYKIPTFEQLNSDNIKFEDGTPITDDVKDGIIVDKEYRSTTPIEFFTSKTDAMTEPDGISVEKIADLKDGDSLDIEKSLETLSMAEKLQTNDSLIPELLERNIGSDAMKVFSDNAEHMPASSLLLDNTGLDTEKVNMLETLKELLNSNGITPENGFKYEGNLRDYIIQAYKIKMFRDGIESI